jgi:hypothetical protein
LKDKPALTGGCQCGAVRYALYSVPTAPSICHCRMCQKAFGNYMAPLAGVPRADHEWTRGEPGIFRSSEAVERGFCRDCGTPLSYSVLERNRISISICSLDEPDRVEPTMQHGIENRRPAFARLQALPEQTTEGSEPPELLARMESRQHPDHDTEKWPP